MSVEQFVLLRVDNREVCGISPCVNNVEQAIVTVQSQGVYLYNIYDQKCVDSWLFGPSAHFDVGAQQLATRTFVAVQDAQFLVSWEEGDAKLKKLVRQRFEEGGEILSVMVDRKLGAKVALLFSSGQLSLCTPGSSGLDETVSLVDSDYFLATSTYSRRTQSELTVFALASQESPVSGVYKLFIAGIGHYGNDNLTIKKYATHELTTKRPGRAITNIVFDAAPGQLFTLLWDDGLLEIYALPGGTHALASQNSLLLTHTLPLAAYHHNLVAKALAQKPAKAPKKGAKPTPALTQRQLQLSGNAIISISDGHVVIIGKKDENENIYLLTVWDIRYGLVTLHTELNLEAILENQTSTSLPTATGNKSAKTRKSLPDRLLRHAVFSSDKNCVLLNFGELVLACPIYVAPSSLAQALGGRFSTEKFLLPRESLSDEPAQQFDYLSNAQAPVKARGMYAGFLKVTQGEFDEIVSKNSKTELAAIAALSDRSQTPDYTTFMEVFNNYTALAAELASHAEHGQEIEISQKYARAGKAARTRPKRWKNLQEYSEHENAKAEKARILTRMQQHVDFSPAFIQAVVARCLEEDYLWHPLRRLIESRCVSVKLNPNLLSVLKANNRLELISATLQFVPDISELEVVGIVRWLISEVDQASLQIFIDEHVYQKGSATAMEVDLSAPGASSGTRSKQSALDCYLNVIVNLDLDSMFLQYCMQLLTLKEMTTMLRFLLNWFEAVESEDQEKQTMANAEAKTNTGFEPPQLGRVIAWANAIIDSHLAELILVPDCARLLRRLHAAITRTLEVCDGMQLLRGCLMHYFDHDPSPRDSVSDYSIEVIRL